MPELARELTDERSRLTHGPRVQLRSQNFDVVIRLVRARLGAAEGVYDTIGARHHNVRVLLVWRSVCHGVTAGAAFAIAASIRFSLRFFACAIRARSSAVRPACLSSPLACPAVYALRRSALAAIPAALCCWSSASAAGSRAG